MQIPVVCKRQVQTYCAAPAVSSEAIIHQSRPLSEHRIANRTIVTNSTETLTSPAADSYCTNLALPSLTPSTTDLNSVAYRLPLISPSISHGMDPNSVPSAQVDSTALGTRTTESVIADLRRPLGHSHHQHKSTQGHPPPNLPGAIHSKTAPRLDPGHQKVNTDPANVRNEDSEDDRQDGNDDDDDDDDDDDVRPSTRTKKISERKRRMNTLADQYIMTLAQNAKDDEVKPEDEAHQSARWLVNQSENREIISSPREYQTELFERAKEKNIIAVLDTGTFRSEGLTYAS